MNKKNKKQFKFSNWKKFFSIVLILFFSVGVAYAINNASTGFRATGGTTQVDSHGVCKKVINSRGEEVFVPTKAANEWSLFRTNLPSGVSLNECCVANYGASCGGSACVNAGSVNCGGTCAGTSNKANGTGCSGGTCSSGVCVAPAPAPTPACTQWDRGTCISYGGGPADASCFPAGTLIDMADGSQKNIEDVEIGEKVISFDFENNKKIISTVNEIEAPIRPGIYTIIFEDGDVLKTTNDHPLYVQKADGKIGWSAVIPRNLEDGTMSLKTEIGDSMFTNELIYKKIIDISYQEGNIQTYNLLDIGQTHNFFAGGFLAHNGCVTAPPSSGATTGNSSGTSSGGGGGGGGRVLCTEAYNRGMISEEMHQVDKDFAREYAETSVMRGYHSWAVPLVRIIKRNDNLADAILPLAVEWSKHAAYKMGILPVNSEIGQVLVEIGFPLCEEIGAMMLEDGNLDYEFSEEDVEREVAKYLGDFDLKSLSMEEAKIQLRERLVPFLARAKEVYIAEKR